MPGQHARLGYVALVVTDIEAAASVLAGDLGLLTIPSTVTRRC